MIEEFELTGPLPAPGSTMLLEASAGTGKTFTLAGLVTRYVAEGAATLDQVLLVTFGRLASRELRDRTRAQIGGAIAALAGEREPANELEAHLCAVPAEVRAQRTERLRDALADFDAATIVTIHQFCSLVLKSLGVASDIDETLTLAESIADLLAETVDDLYLARFGNGDAAPPFDRTEALTLARTVIGDPAQLRPEHPDPSSGDGVRREFVDQVKAELAQRKRRLGICDFNDLLELLAAELRRPGSDAAQRMRRRWQVVMVDEFQDTDPVQWEVLDGAFNGHATLVLIGDPKQAIYGFRGGDVYTYLAAARGAADRRTLGTNWRSDAVLVDALQAVLAGAQLGHPQIVVPPIQASRRGHRLAGAPQGAPFRLRTVSRDTFGLQGLANIPMDRLRRHIPADLAADVAALLASGATFEGRPVNAGDIAVLVERHADAALCKEALNRLGIPVVHTGDADVFVSRAADDWLCLLNAFESPHRSGLVRAAACTMFFGETAQSLADGGDELTDRVAQTLREWADQARLRGITAVYEAAQLAGMGRRVLAARGGERHMTDLAHLAELLHEAAHTDRLGLPALCAWLRRQREDHSGSAEHSRRLDSDAGAVQIMTVFTAKGLQFPVVYLPFLFHRFVRSEGILLYHERAADGREQRCLHLGDKFSPDRAEVKALHQHEDALDHIRITYVALTRAQSQVVAWWAPALCEPGSGLGRLLRGREPGVDEVPDRCRGKISDADARAVFTGWQDAGGPVLEDSVIGPDRPVPAPVPPGELSVRQFHRGIDTGWVRTSYSGLIRHAEQAGPAGPAGVGSEPESMGRDDEAQDVEIAAAAGALGADLVSPLAEMPGGTTFGSLVHAVLETADPFAADLAGELAGQVALHRPWWPVDADDTTLGSALVPLHDSPLGPLADGFTLRRVGRADRLRELGFEIPLAGGDRQGVAPRVRVADVGTLLEQHLDPGDPFAGYVHRLTSAGLGGQSLRGYLSGSLDVVLRLPGPRYLVVDYKTNNLGQTAADYTGERLTAAMLHSDYPLQALLYTAVLHRFLRWRQPGYDPATHLGGVLYLFVRGMCGADTPIIDGHPAGVFSWRPPVALVGALSDLLDEGLSR